jgi:hypothetical protein
LTALFAGMGVHGFRAAARGVDSGQRTLAWQLPTNSDQLARSHCIGEMALELHRGFAGVAESRDRFALGPGNVTADPILRSSAAVRVSGILDPFRRGGPSIQGGLPTRGW